MLLDDLDPTEWSDGPESMRNRLEIQFYALAMLHGFLQLDLSSENNHFDFFIRIP